MCPWSFWGWLEQSKLPAVYAAIGRLRSGAPFTEGHPKVLLEAMACGLPCVASDCAGNRSLITDGETGLLFDPYRPAELAARLRQIFADPRPRGAPREGGEEMVVARYDLSALVAREIALVGAIAELLRFRIRAGRTRCPLRDTQRPHRGRRVQKPEGVEVEIHDLGLWGSVLRRPKAGAFVLGRDTRS